MITGIVAGLLAGAFWGLTFVAGALVPGVSPLLLTVARFLVFGLASCLMLPFLRFNPLTQLSGREWRLILALGATGNSVYFLLMTTGVTQIGAAPVAIIVGSLPVIMAIVGNLRRPAIPWAWLVPALLLVTAGVALINGANMALPGTSPTTILAGIAVTSLAVASWGWYGIVNAEFLSAPDNRFARRPVLWTALFGLGTLIATLPLAVALPLLEPAALVAMDPGGWGRLLAVSAALGLGSTWLATLLWNLASARLPTYLLGLLIVSETSFALVYNAALAGRWLTPVETVSIVLLLAGVGWGVVAGNRGRPA